MRKIYTKQIVVNVEVDGIQITGTPLTPDAATKIHEDNSKIVGKGMEARKVMDNVGISRDTFIALVENWSGALDQDEKELKCTAANKKLVFKFDQKFVSDAIKAINDAKTLLTKIEKKT